MPDLIGLTLIGLLGTFCLGMVRVLRGPSAGDRLLSLLLTSTTSVAVLLVLDVGAFHRGFLDAALALAVLGPVTAVALIASSRLDGERDSAEPTDVG